MENVHVQRIYPLNMVKFHGDVSLPEGISYFQNGWVRNIYHIVFHVSYVSLPMKYREISIVRFPFTETFINFSFARWTLWLSGGWSGGNAPTTAGGPRTRGAESPRSFQFGWSWNHMEASWHEYAHVCPKSSKIPSGIWQITMFHG